VIIDNSATAIYRQIIDYFEAEIASGRLAPAEKIEPIRGLAMLFKVNPNTVQKALRELEWNNLLFKDRTNGKFVTQDEQRIKELRECLAKTTIDDFLNAVQKLNIDLDSVLELIKKEWNVEDD
jgi:GntR family transcriptional regulator